MTRQHEPATPPQETGRASVAAQKGHEGTNPTETRGETREKRAHLWGKGSGRGRRGLLGVDGGSRRLLRDWLLCTCLSTLLFRSSNVVMIPHCGRVQKISPVGGLLLLILPLI